MSIGDWVVIIALVLLILYLFYKYIEASSPELCEVCGKKSTGTYYDGYVVEMHLCDCDAAKSFPTSRMNLKSAPYLELIAFGKE
jgi:hypothetical protein